MSTQVMLLGSQCNVQRTVIALPFVPKYSVNLVPTEHSSICFSVCYILIRMLAPFFGEMFWHGKVVNYCYCHSGLLWSLYKHSSLYEERRPNCGCSVFFLSFAVIV